jgi:hypothetical protein
VADKKLRVRFENVGKAEIVRPKHFLNVRGYPQEEGLSQFVTAAAVQVASERDGADSVSHDCGTISWHLVIPTFLLLSCNLCLQPSSLWPDFKALRWK